jgi:hypothetical protein
LRARLAQQRLHAHDLVWHERRKREDRPVAAGAQGVKQRCRGSRQHREIVRRPRDALGYQADVATRLLHTDDVRM